MKGISPISRPGCSVEEVSTVIVPAKGVSLTDAIKQANPQDAVELLVRQKEKNAVLTLFKRRDITPSINYIDGCLYFKCSVPEGAPTIAFNIEKEVVFGPVHTIIVIDNKTNKEWSNSFFSPPMNLSSGGILTIAQKTE